MPDAYCKSCKGAMSGDEFGLSLMEYPTKKAYIKDLQEFHDAEHHTTLQEKLTCDCGHKSKDASKALDHYTSCPKSGYKSK